MMPWLTATLYDRFMRATEEASFAAWRRELLAGVRGRVLEIGAGTGASVPYFPASAARVVLAEPDPRMRARLARRVAAARDPRFEVSDAAIERLPFPDASFDAVVLMLVLCSVADVGRALDEARRVLAPGGALVFMEHVAADERPTRLAWQTRIEPGWKHLTGNCHLTRRTADAIRARFAIQRETRESARKALPIVRTVVRGIATKTE